MWQVCGSFFPVLLKFCLENTSSAGRQENPMRHLCVSQGLLCDAVLLCLSLPFSLARLCASLCQTAINTFTDKLKLWIYFSPRAKSTVYFRMILYCSILLHITCLECLWCAALHTRHCSKLFIKPWACYRNVPKGPTTCYSLWPSVGVKTPIFGGKLLYLFDLAWSYSLWLQMTQTAQKQKPITNK
jgi:hypothetical protein